MAGRQNEPPKSPKPRWLNAGEDRAWRNYIWMVQQLGAAIERDLVSDTNLSMPDYLVLVHLSEDETHRLRLHELGQRLLWSKSRLSHHLSRMESRGLVRRSECNEDGRGQWAVLTDEGLAAIQEAAPEHVESVRRHLIDLLTPDQLATLADIAQVVLDHLGEKPKGNCHGPDSLDPSN